jgi:spermidine synthase
MQHYHFIPILSTVIISYILTIFMVKIKKITILQHRQFWNLVLLITFLVSGLLGLILAFSIDQKLSLGWYLPLLWYHVEFGIVMSLISFFHLFWHLPYFTSIFNKPLNSKK